MSGAMNGNGDGSDGELFDPNKIKNLNLTDELKQQLLVIDSEVLNPLQEINLLKETDNGESCGTYIPKDSLVSLCRGCDPDKL